VNSADDRHFSSNHPTHDAARFLANAFDAGHQVRKITELAKKLTGPFDGRP
jgi:hypothetical protein